MRIEQATAIAIFTFLLSSPVYAFGERELAEQCRAAVDAGDDAAFQAVAEQLLELRHVFDSKAVAMASECLTAGFGTEWGYSAPQGRFVSRAELDAEARAAAEADAARDRAIASAREKEAAEAAELAAFTADREAMRIANERAVADLVYESCTTLLDRDQVAAMTNSVCVESFLANGLPAL